MDTSTFSFFKASPPKMKKLSNKVLPASYSSHVYLECTVQEPLIQYIDWYSDGSDVSHLSGGVISTATAVKSLLRVNFTSAGDIFNTYKYVDATEAIDII